MDLVLSSDDHCRILAKVLEEAHLPKGISKEGFGHLVDHLLENNVISFTDDDIPKEGRGHRKPLHIAVISSGYIMNGVLIDGGSALNICPLSTLEKMNINPKRLRASHVVVRAFDGSRRDTIGEIELPVEIGPCTFDISFQVLDIAASYNLLLGRPWIHMAGAVPSTLHQQIKLIVDGNLVTISAECDDPSPSRNGLPVINVDESAAPASFQALEISTPHYRCLGTPAVKPKVSPELTFVAKEMMKMKFQPGQGLGKSSQGIIEPIQLPHQIGKAGLGYHEGIARRHHQGAAPTRLAGDPMAKANNERGTSKPVIGTGAEELTPTSDESTKRESFLQEVAQKFETRCYIPGQLTSDGEGKDGAMPPGAQQSVPVIDWAGLVIPEEGRKRDSGDVAVITGEVSDVKPPFIQRISSDLTTDNWTMEPVISKQG